MHKELEETLLSFPEYNRDPSDKSLDEAKNKLKLCYIIFNITYNNRL